ncbi:MAG: recombinase family protein [Butyricicoccus pullicaecorum]|nr:recombinase family protein [Butyricicoccus pullicaecorum]
MYNRQRAGRIAAQKQGVNLGRPSKKCSDKRFSKIRDLYESHQISAEESAQRLHVSVSTFYRWLRESREHD